MFNGAVSAVNRITKGWTRRQFGRKYLLQIKKPVDSLSTFQAARHVGENGV